MSSLFGMALTVAAKAEAEELEEDRSPLFGKADWLVALVAALISGGVYFYTAQPNVGLLDSGEFIVAAQHFGVPHPTGYPLWTILAWLFQLLPLGNAAWEINLFSGLCGALAVGVTALLGSSMLRWMMPWWGDSEEPARPLLVALLALSFSLLFAFSFSFWTQAVIAEVYTLHGLLIGLFLLSLYWWVRQPERDLPVLITFFVFALGMSNHHLTLALAPLPLLLPLLVRRAIFWEVLTGSLVSASLVYLVFAWLSSDATTWSTAMRFFYFAMFGLIVLLALKWQRTNARVVLFVPLAVILGLLPYAYMPLASSTNPPMNWGYTSTAEGFFYSINRSQYDGSLSDLIVRTLGRGMGTAPQVTKEVEYHGRVSTLELGRRFSEFYWQKLLTNFTPWAAVAFLVAVVALLRLPLPQRAFLYLLFIGFFLAAFLQPIMERSETTLDAWSLQFPYHGYAYLMFSLICLTGTGFILTRLESARPSLAPLSWLLLLLPLWTGWHNAPLCSQRDHWFGWTYGHDMLAELPKGAVLFGGTDPGRFIPTYMILGESFVDPEDRRDPDFDRRDLVIITQNALADSFYQSYINDHYAPGRPSAKGWFEKWLGRDEQYPSAETILPTYAETVALLRQVTADLPPGSNMKDPGIGAIYHGTIAQWIFEKNKDRREFFVEESFPMDWMYPYAVPHGLVFRLEKEPLDTLPPDSVAQDFQFWNDYVDGLLSDPNYHEDFDAQRSFAKLRNSTGNLYRSREMWSEAEKAYRQALQLQPNNSESLAALNKILQKQKRWGEMVAIWDRALLDDPRNRSLQLSRQRVTQLRQGAREIEKLQEVLDSDPEDSMALSHLMRLLLETDQVEEANRQLEVSGQVFGDDLDYLQFATEFCNLHGLWEAGLGPARKWTAVAPDQATAWLVLARMEFANRDTDAFFEAAAQAVELGGGKARTALAGDAIYSTLQSDSKFQALLAP